MDKRRMHQLLAIAEEHARTARARVRQQEERVRKLPAGSHQREISEKTLKNLQDLAETMEKHKDLIRTYNKIARV